MAELLIVALILQTINLGLTIKTQKKNFFEDLLTLSDSVYMINASFLHFILGLFIELAANKTGLLFLLFKEGQEMQRSKRAENPFFFAKQIFENRII